MNGLDNRILKDDEGASTDVPDINQPAGFNQLGGRPNITPAKKT